MEINLTLIGQLITFAIVVWFTMRFVWPPLMANLDARQLLISNGLAQAAQAATDLEQAHAAAKTMLDEAKAQAQVLLEQTHKRSLVLIDEARSDAQEEGQRMINIAKNEIVRESLAAKESLRHQVASLVVAGATKILGKEINQAANQQLLDDVINQQL